MSLPPKSLRPQVGAHTWRALAAACVAAVVLTANKAVLGFDWMFFDDDINILLNPNLGGFNHETFAWIFTNIDYVRRYLPLGWCGFDALLVIDGYNAGVFHTASWVFTGLNGALAVFVFDALLRQGPETAAPSPAAAGRRLAAATFAALLCSLHPFRAESAGWISGLLYLTATTCAGLAILIHVSAPAVSRWRQILGSLTYLASLFIYPVFLVLPAVMTWRAAWGEKNGRWSRIRLEAKNLTGWWLSAALAFGINGYALYTASGPYRGVALMERFGFFERCDYAIKTYLHYIAHTVWPENSSVFYGSTPHLLKNGHASLVLGVVLPIVLGLLLWRKTRDQAVVAMVALFLSLSLLLGLMEPEFHAGDRYAVLWLGIVALILARVLMLPNARPVFVSKWVAALAMGAALWSVYPGALAPWRSFATMQKRIDEVTQDWAHPSMSYARPAVVFWLLGDRDESARRLRDGLARFPDSPLLREAEKEISRLEIRWRARIGTRTSIPPVAVMHSDIGMGWLQRGQRAPAAAHFKRAFQLAPEFTEAAVALVATTAPSPPAK